jgi:hypothetical protein
VLVEVDASAVDDVSMSSSIESALLALATHCPHVSSISVDGEFVGIGAASTWAAIIEACPLQTIASSGRGLTDASLQEIAAGWAARRMHTPPLPLKLSLMSCEGISSIGFCALGPITVDVLDISEPCNLHRADHATYASSIVEAASMASRLCVTEFTRRPELHFLDVCTLLNDLATG